MGEEQVGYNAIWLLKAIKRIIQGITTSSNEYHAAFCATRDFYRTKQFDKSVEDYYTDFENAQELVQQANVYILSCTDLLAKERTKNANVTNEEVRQKFVAMAFVLNADGKRFGGLWDDLHNNLLKGQDTLPTCNLRCICSHTGKGTLPILQEITGIIKGTERPDEMVCNLCKMETSKYVGPSKVELVLFALTLCASVAIDQDIMRMTAQTKMAQEVT